MSPLFVVIPVAVAAGAALLVALVLGVVRWAGRRARQDLVDAQPPPPWHPHAVSWQPPRRRSWVFRSRSSSRYTAVFWPVPITRDRAEQFQNRIYTVVALLLLALIGINVVRWATSGAG